MFPDTHLIIRCNSNDNTLVFGRCLWECAQNGSKSFQMCGVVQILSTLTRDDIATFRGRRSTLWLLRCASAIFVAGAGNPEIARCDGGDISWQAQYFARVRRVDAERFVAGAGNREVASCGRGGCRCHIGISARAGVVWRGWNRETAWQGC